MEYVRVTKENLEREHICCAISNNNDIQVASKKAWLAGRFDEGLVFLKSVERGKCFIEYIPAENAWNPIDADGYTYIDCLWVSIRDPNTNRFLRQFFRPYCVKPLVNPTGLTSRFSLSEQKNCSQKLLRTLKRAFFE